FAKGVANAIAGDSTQPGAQLGRLTQVAKLSPRSHERFLRYVLALAQAASGAVSEGTNQRLITRYDAAKGLRVSSEGVGDQRGIIGTRPHDGFHHTHNICLEQGFGGDKKDRNSGLPPPRKPGRQARLL